MSKVAATIVEEKLELVAPFLPINRHRKRASKFEYEKRTRETQERKSGCQG